MRSAWGDGTAAPNPSESHRPRPWALWDTLPSLAAAGRDHTPHPAPIYETPSVPNQLSRGGVCTWRGPCGPLAPILSGPGPCIPPGMGPRGLGPGPRGSRPRGSMTLASMALASSTRGSRTRGSRPRASRARASITRGSSPRGSNPRGSSPRGSLPTAGERQGKVLKGAVRRGVWEQAHCLLRLGANKRPEELGAEGTSLEEVPRPVGLSLLALGSLVSLPKPPSYASCCGSGLHSDFLSVHFKPPTISCPLSHLEHPSRAPAALPSVVGVLPWVPPSSHGGGHGCHDQAYGA